MSDSLIRRCYWIWVFVLTSIWNCGTGVDTTDFVRIFCSVFGCQHMLVQIDKSSLKSKESLGSCSVNNWFCCLFIVCWGNVEFIQPGLEAGENRIKSLIPLRHTPCFLNIHLHICENLCRYHSFPTSENGTVLRRGFNWFYHTINILGEVCSIGDTQLQKYKV